MNTLDDGRVADATGLSQVEPSSSGSLAPSGFDPSRGLHILQHSLGVDQYGRGNQYRNHFATGPGSTDYDDCNALTEVGLMVVRRQPAGYGGMDMFFVTDAGRAYVAENSPHAPKLTRGQRRYRDWLNVSDATGESFMEFCRRRDSDGSPKGGDGEAGSVACDDSAGPKDIAQGQAS